KGSKLDEDSDEIEQEGETQPINCYHYRRTWSIDRTLWAMINNRLQELVTVLPHWEKGKAPKFQTIGPAEWRSEEPETKPEPKRDKLAEAMAVFGFSGPAMDAGQQPIEGSDDVRVEEAMAAFGFKSGDSHNSLAAMRVPLFLSKERRPDGKQSQYWFRTYQGHTGH